MTRRFVPTHEITLTDTRDGTRSAFPVHLEDGVAYTREEWTSSTSADWEYSADGWTFQGRTTPAAHFSVSVRKLAPGPTGRTGSAAKNRTIRATDTEWQRWTAAAKRAKQGVGDWLRKLADAAAGPSEP